VMQHVQVRIAILAASRRHLFRRVRAMMR
jgi:hypothetical protein